MPGRIVKKDGPHPFDVLIGQRIRARRTLLGMSQATVAEALDLNYQQLQKYEKGTNRISASRLFELSKVLDVPVSYFFEEIPMDKPAANISPDAMTKAETLDIVRAYYGIKDPAVRKRFLELAKAIAN